MIRRHLLQHALGAGALAALPRLSNAQAAPAGPVEVAGVRYEPQATLGGAKLLLNGAGVRWKVVVKVYTAGLYLTTKATTTEQVLAAAGPKRMHIAMLREIDANELGRLFTKGMQENAPRDEMMKSIPGTVRLGEIFAARKRLNAGDQFFVDYIPGAGTVVVVNGQAQNEPIREPEFFNALLRIWLGDSPADTGLKAALLGQDTRSTRQR